ncbi:MAG: hypothetical protein LBJ73_01545 [Rickettsiales bacterium]|jgi:hypothetical protein|nr:hypothetical protein [Rickettsiales bacterium]
MKNNQKTQETTNGSKKIKPLILYNLYFGTVTAFFALLIISSGRQIGKNNAQNDEIKAKQEQVLSALNNAPAWEYRRFEKKRTWEYRQLENQKKSNIADFGLCALSLLGAMVAGYGFYQVNREKKGR